MDGFQTVVATRGVGDPALIPELVKVRVNLKYVHESLTVRRLRLEDLSSHGVVAAVCSLCIRCWVS